MDIGQLDVGGILPHVMHDADNRVERRAALFGTVNVVE